jgi:hypothetical protein
LGDDSRPERPIETTLHTQGGDQITQSIVRKPLPGGHVSRFSTLPAPLMVVGLPLRFHLSHSLHLSSCRSKSLRALSYDDAASAAWRRRDACATAPFSRQGARLPPLPSLSPGPSRVRLSLSPPSLAPPSSLPPRRPPTTAATTTSVLSLITRPSFQRWRSCPPPRSLNQSYGSAPDERERRLSGPPPLEWLRGKIFSFVTKWPLQGSGIGMVSLQVF